MELSIEEIKKEIVFYKLNENAYLNKYKNKLSSYKKSLSNFKGKQLLNIGNFLYRLSRFLKLAEIDY